MASMIYFLIVTAIYQTLLFQACTFIFALFLCFNLMIGCMTPASWLMFIVDFSSIAVISWRTSLPINLHSNLPMRLLLLSSQLYLKVTLCSCPVWKFNMNWTSVKRSSVFNGHFFFIQKVIVSVYTQYRK
jgi:hypothetical protein